MKNVSILKTSVLVGGFISSQAFAHFPLMSCHLEQDKVICEAGYSDGSTAVDYDVEMYDYDDNLIAKVTTDKRSIAEFTHPQTDFYLVFDAGHENPVEVDIVELKEK
ncbi:Uncharacterised protein [Vibrio owensii]|uniref:hypothetical protein n=1 Tax=Vibrio harveyi group TaxID=717610 RepID=UPI0003A4E754|nr:MULTISPECIES: hypothetical protein [Vibrio harveyi group]MDA0385359.1 hypothetical protein [Vibrio owensii]TDE20359.1 hypothetical protein E1100_22975 [Vibrio owensii]SUP39057.1 Uncharacterised protein [Vibrio owensii]